MEPWGPGKVKVGLGLSRDLHLSPQWQRWSQPLQAPHGWVSTSHPRWAGTKFPPSPWRTLQQHPARLSSEKGSDASPCPRRGLGGQGTHLSWEVHSDGGEGHRSPALIPSLAARALPTHQHLLGDAGAGVRVVPPSTRSVCRNKRPREIIKCSAMGCANRDLQLTRAVNGLEPTVPPSLHHNPARSGIYHCCKERVL